MESNKDICIVYKNVINNECVITSDKPVFLPRVGEFIVIKGSETLYWEVCSIEHWFYAGDIDIRIKPRPDMKYNPK